MKPNMRHGVWVLAVGMAMGIGGCSGRGEDYSRNQTYQQGVLEGQADHVNSRQPSKKNFDRDEDRKAYEAGYQKGHGN
jgi:hypothetical protein